MAEMSESSIKAMVGSNFAILLLLGASLNALWRVIHTMQISSHFLLINISFPARAQIYYTIVMKIMAFEIFEFPIENFLSFNMDESPFSQVLNNMGFET